MSWKWRPRGADGPAGGCRRTLRSLAGAVELTLSHGRDPHDGRWCCPLLEAWGVSAHQEFTPAARRRLAFTASASGTHAEAAEVAAEWGLPVDDATMPAPVLSAGARAEEQTGLRLASPPPGREPARAPSELAVLMIDGCLLRFRGPGWGRTRPTQPRVEWHELKLGVFCREAHAAQTAGGRGLLSDKRLVSWQGEAGELGRRLHWEARADGLGRAARVRGVNDGAAWIWKLVADRILAADLLLVSINFFFSPLSNFELWPASGTQRADMHSFRYVKGQLQCEGVALAKLAEQHGTPLYVYSQATLTDHYTKLDQALAPLDHLICFAMKSNSNLAVIRTLANLGSGFDTVSAGEVQRVVEAGGDARKCVFAGVGKTEEEIAYALRQDIYCFNVESEAELKRISKVAVRLRKIAPVAVRVNPNVDAGTHAKITTGTYENKFGIAFEQIEAVYARAAKLPNLRLRGLQMHIGSQLTDVKPFRLAVEKVAPLVDRLNRKHGFDFFSVGGGIGIVYRDALASGDAAWWQTKEGKKVLTPQGYADTLVPLLQPLGLKILLEPGRFLTGNAGALLTRVEFIKKTGKKNFVIVDAAMNDLIRPAFYDSFHEIVPLKKKAGATVSSDVVGPICESGDYFAKDRPLPKVGEGDYLALLSAGAYGSVMGSNYNSRGLAAEVLVNGTQSAVVRRRQEITDIWANEQTAPWQ